MEYNLYYYDSVLDAVVMRDKEDNELVIECAKANSQVIFDEPEDEGYSKVIPRYRINLISFRNPNRELYK